MSSREFAEWMAYYSIEPFGEEPANLRHGILTSVLANAHRDAKKQPQPFKPEDFMPKFDQPRADNESKWQATKEKFMALVKRPQRSKE